MIAEAALNNAAWCEALCRAHGLPGVLTQRAWTNPRRTPPFYPDAVTLSPEATDADVLPFIDATPGASIKDSFAVLAPPGFELLFEATWLHRPSAAQAGPAGGWEVVRDERALRAWERAWAGERGLFPAALLADPSVRVLAGREGGETVRGCVLNETPGGRTVGISNLFGDDAWPGAVALAAALFPGRDLVGYETDPGPAVAHGFIPAGPLRVWLRG
ncbi:hypothetical protein ACQEUU_06210 [Nonomuraea sp. CA-218870]|uniref:hypothetical protein n=1 Tax=Nonomuraea sp. CA-218870 TaxID=3239998 RepID=UPI003D8D1A37